MIRLRLGVFSPSVLLDLARGPLAEAGLDVEAIPVPSSPSQFESLDARQFDAVFTNPDNVLAYRRLEDNPLGRRLDVEIVTALDRGLGLALAVRPGVETPAAGLRFGVDVPGSGFAFVGFALLERIGLAPGDYDVLPLGSTPRRAAALIAGECDATVLGAGSELVAQVAGARLIGTASDLGPYLGTVLARRVGAHPAVRRLAETLTRTARAIVDGQLDREAAASAQHVLGLDPDAARAHVAVLRDPVTGLVADGVADRPSIRTVIELRRRYRPHPDLDAVRVEELVAVAD